MPLTASILLVCAVLLAALGLHPFVTYPLSLVAMRRWLHVAPPSGVLPAPVSPSVSLVFCAYNEAAVLPAKLANLEAVRAREPDLQVHVYVDGSNDGSVELMQAQANRYRVVIGETRQGKSVGMNRLLAGVTSDLVMFTDANIELDPEAIGRVRRHFADPAVGGICGHISHRVADNDGAPAATAGYWQLEQWLKRLESEIDTTLMADGSLFVIRRRLFREVPSDIIDDMFTSASVMCDGYRLLQVDDVCGYELIEARTGQEVRRKRRIVCRAYRCHRLLWPRLRLLPWHRVYMYLSHKYLRWLSGVLLLAAALLAGLALLLTFPLLVGWLAVLGVVLLGALFVLRRRWFEMLQAGFMGLLAPGLGVLDALRGRTYVTWTPVRGSAAP